MRLSLKYVILFALAAIVFAMAIGVSSKARADVEYTWSYDITNAYHTAQITYSFSNLVVGRTYRWDMYLVNPTTGDPTISAGFQELVVTTATTATVNFGGAPQNPPLTDTVLFPDDYVGPIAIVDSNGTILGRHFVAQQPGYFDSLDSGWFLSSGNTALNDKQAIGTGQFTGDCEGPAYAPINADGWQHTRVPCSVTTLQGGYALLHYQIDPTYVPTGSDKIRLFLMPTAEVALTIDLDDIINFQTDNWTGATDQAYSFVVINTAGNFLPFVDNSRAVGAYTTDDNPMMASIDTGVYNLVRNNPGFVSDGESVWIVSDDPARKEWTLTALSGSVSEGGQQTLRASAVTRNVWESYHGYQEVEDLFSSFSDTTVYGFVRNRSHRYTAANTAFDGVTPTWTNRAVAINSGLATVAEMEFVVSTTYDILTLPPTLEESLNEVIGNTGLDTVSGRAAILTIVLFFGMLITATFVGLSGNIFAYLIVWTAIGGLYVFGGFGTDLIDVVYTIMTVGMWIFAMVNATGGENELN